MTLTGSDRPPNRPLSRGRAILDLELAWASIRAASAYIQQLDQLIVRHDAWGDAYADAQDILDSAMGRLEGWKGSPFPAERDALIWTSSDVYSCLRAAHYHLQHFDWSEAQGSLYAGGLALLAMAGTMGVEL